MGEKNNWRYRLRGDPANWLLDADDNPSVAFWFLRDIVHRPEDATAMLDLRDKILFSQPVQEIFAAQNDLGYWHNPDLLDEPKHRSTLWTLALLTELGIPRVSRRARAACEFVLENLRLADESLLGLLAHSLVYFNYGNDARLTQTWDTVARDAARGNVFALWTLGDVVGRGDPRGSPGRGQASPLHKGAEKILEALAHGERFAKTFGAFPSIDPNDAMLALRVLAQLNRLDDERARDAIQKVWARQGTGARWAMEKDYSGSTVAQSLIAQNMEKWGTLNALRVITRT